MKITMGLTLLMVLLGGCTPQYICPSGLLPAKYEEENHWVSDTRDTHTRFVCERL